MIHLALTILAGLFLLWVLHELWFLLLMVLCAPFAAWGERRELRERERMRVKRVLKRIAYECSEDSLSLDALLREQDAYSEALKREDAAKDAAYWAAMAKVRP